MMMQVVKSTNAVDKFATAISPQTISIGVKMGRNAVLKSLICSCLEAVSLATYIISANFAKSEDWKVIPINGMVIHLLAELISVPKRSVKNNKPMAVTKSMGAHFEYFI